MNARECLYLGGTVYTVEEAYPTAEAVAVRDGIIVAVGSASACRATLSRSHQVVDLNGGTLLPGFCDSHMHPVSTIFAVMQSDLKGMRDIPELIERLKHADRALAPDKWVIGLNFDEQDMAEPRLPNRHDLDRVSLTRPVVVVKHDGHSVIANSAALTAAGITPGVSAPEGGSIDRDETGAPLGIFRENAKPLIMNHLPLPGLEELVAGAQKASAIMLGHGITSLGLILETGQEGGSSYGAFDVPAIEILRPHIPQALYALIMSRDVEAVLKLKSSCLGDTSGRTRVGGVKIIADGTFGSLTAAMEEDFSDSPGNRGFMICEETELYELMLKTHISGLQLGIHAIGDKANRICIELYEKILKAHPRQNHRHRIEHASILYPDLLRRAQALGLVLCVQPLFIRSDMPYLDKRIGKARRAHTYPFRSIVDMGLVAAGSSDAPVETSSVLEAIECAVTREGYVMEQAVGITEAIQMYTIHAAYAQFEEDARGSIAIGKQADFVLLEENPLKVPAHEIHAIPVRATFIAGEMKYPV
ncbi:MAG TPA: amidohydrolase [Deltaproteobacteria bacterium]|nr:amidohydrolase [Deltaproteobacteria bacterium]